MRNPDRNVGLNGAIVLASLLTNVVHAVGDFFWYTPSCMLLLAIQLACVCRLSHLTRINALEGNRESVLQGNPVAGSRLVACGALCCVVGASLWMAYIKLPAALAESDQMWAATLSRRGREFYSDNDDYRAAQRERWQSLIRAARLNPHNSRFLEEAAQAYIECFNERQETSQNPIPLGQLRDAVKASQFESQAATREWLNRAVGENVKLLRLAIKTFRKALRESPLRAESYIELVELGFVVGMSESTEATYVRHASRLRPRDSKILFAVGREALLKGDSDRAMESWRIAFQQSASLRKIIAELLASQLEPAYLLDKLAPDWNSIALLAGAFERAGRQNEAHELWNRYIRDGRRRLKVSMDDTEYLNVVLNLRDAHQAMRESGHGIRMMTLGLKRLPDSFPLRITLGRDLFTQGRYVEAADHLQWCAARQPDDSALQNLTAHALEEKLKSSTPQERKNGNGSPENVPR